MKKYRIKQDKLYKSDFDDTLAIHRDREYLQHRNENEENLQNYFLNAYLNPEKFYEIIEPCNISQLIFKLIDILRKNNVKIYNALLPNDVDSLIE